MATFPETGVGMQRTNWRASLFTIGVVAAACSAFPQQFCMDEPEPTSLKISENSVDVRVEAKRPRFAVVETNHESVMAMFDFSVPFQGAGSERHMANAESMPDFSAIETVAEKKQAFIDFVLPLVAEENRRILQQRADIESLKHRLSLSPSIGADDLLVIADLCEKYNLQFSGIVSVRLLDRLLERVDVIPPSLVLSQAATESGWGTSRLAVKKNNLFGHFGFVAGGNRGSKAINSNYRPISFESPSHAVERYFSNLNTHDAYDDFRELRSRLRKQNRAITGLVLVSELQAYSSRGEAYVRQIASVIRANGLSNLDEHIRYL